MNICQNDGKCYKKCDCKCFDNEEDDDDDLPDRECICEHKNHNGYCPNTCPNQCHLIECRNYEFCKAKSP